MKKAFIILGVVIVLFGGGFALYRLFFSNSFGAVNVNIGALDEKPAAAMCKSAGAGHARIVCFADALKKTLDERRKDEG
jgi:hypothetical protein